MYNNINSSEINVSLHSMEKRIGLLENQLDDNNKSAQKTGKDIWDKISAISNLITGGLIALIGIVVTYMYQQKQRITEKQKNEQELTIAKIQTVSSFMPQLISLDVISRKIALKAISILDFDIMLTLAENFWTEGGFDALRDLQWSQNGVLAAKAKKAVGSIIAPSKLLKEDLTYALDLQKKGEDINEIIKKISKRKEEYIKLGVLTPEKGAENLTSITYILISSKT